MTQAGRYRTGERCPTCGQKGLPPLKTCALGGCETEFYVGEGGKADAIYCTRAHARAAYQRSRRARLKAESVARGREV